MSPAERPFLFFVTRDEEGREVVKIQGDGIPLTEKRLTLLEAARQTKAFAQAVIDMIEREDLNKSPRGSENS